MKQFRLYWEWKHFETCFFSVLLRSYCVIFFICLHVRLLLHQRSWENIVYEPLKKSMFDIFQLIDYVFFRLCSCLLQFVRKLIWRRKPSWASWRPESLTWVQHFAFFTSTFLFFFLFKSQFQVISNKLSYKSSTLQSLNHFTHRGQKYMDFFFFFTAAVKKLRLSSSLTAGEIVATDRNT